MALPVTIPNEFANATASIPLSQLDTNFNTLANAVNGISDGSETLANVTATVANITTLDATNVQVTNIKAKDGTAAGSIADSTGVVTLASSVLTTTDINGGTIDATAIGGSTPAAGSFTTLNTSGAVVFNDAGANVDFRVEGDTDANLLFVSASTDRVGIGTNAPGQKTEIRSDGSGEAVLLRLRRNNSTDQGFLDLSVDPDANLVSYASAGTSSGAHRFLAGSTERMRLTSDGYLRMASGSGGIQFGGDTAAANALDDYEEGTWTPALVNGGTPSYTVQNGLYTKIGRFVVCTFQLTYTGASNGESTRLSGLPFATTDSNLNRTGFAGTFSTLDAKLMGTTGVSTTAVYVEDLELSSSFNGIGTALLTV